MSKAQSPKPELTPRETEVLRAIAEGHASKTIADRLGIALKTVETHRRNLYAKLGIHTAAQAVRVAIKTFLL